MRSNIKTNYQKGAWVNRSVLTKEIDLDILFPINRSLFHGQPVKRRGFEGREVGEKTSAVEHFRIGISS